jgi:hypothetical protein
MMEPLSTKTRMILREEIGSVAGMLGPGDGALATSSLRARLFAEASRAQQLFYGALLMVLVVFVVMLYLLLINAGEAATLIAISGASGISISGLIWFALRIARDSSQYALLLVILERLPSQDALAAMQAVLAGSAGVLQPDISNANLEENA